MDDYDSQQLTELVEGLPDSLPHIPSSSSREVLEQEFISALQPQFPFPSLSNYKLVLRHRWNFSLGCLSYPGDMLYLLNQCQATNPRVSKLLFRKEPELGKTIYQHEIFLSIDEARTVPGFSQTITKKVIYVPKNFLNNFIYPYFFIDKTEKIAEVKLHFNNIDIVRLLRNNNFSNITKIRLKRQ